MPFNLVRISQQDPRWKDIKLGNSSLTIGSYGCALTCVAMYLSGFDYAEDPASLNTKLKSKGGFVDAAIVWGAVSAIHPAIKYKNLILCRDTDAPIDMIGNSVAAGQPVLLEVDRSPSPGLQTHWVVAYQKVGKDFLVLDPWPYPTDKAEVSLMARYSQGQELKRTITAAVFYEAQGAGAPIPAVPPTDGYYVRVLQSLEAGLRLRSQPTTASDTLTIEPAGVYLKVVEAEAGARAKVGVLNQWLQVRDGNGLQGYVAAWYVENASGMVPAPASPPTPPVTPPSHPPVSIPPVGPPPGAPPQRSRKSVADGLEAVTLEAPANQRLTPAASASATTRLVANIWNRYGGLLGALSGVLKIQPGVAVAVLAIESGGQAFADGRMIIRFENHIFYQYWGKNHTDEFNQHFRFNSGQTWTGHQWRPVTTQNWIDCHTSQASEWEVFNFARTLDETAAKMSISMGAPQIMGFNYSIIGYSTVHDMFTAFSTSERDQVIGFFDFIQGVLPGGGAIQALQKLDYKGFATSYNGSGQADYYANLMKTANDAFTALKPAQPSAPPVVTPPPAVQPPPVVPPEASQPPVPPVVTPPPVVEPPPVVPPVVAPPAPPSTTPPAVTPPPAQPPAPVPPDDEQRMDVIVNTNVSKPGLNLRQEPSTSSTILGVLPIGSKMRVLDDPTLARARIGKAGQWIEVKDEKGRRGFVGAAYVKEA